MTLEKFKSSLIGTVIDVAEHPEEVEKRLLKLGIEFEQKDTVSEMESDEKFGDTGFVEFFRPKLGVPTLAQNCYVSEYRDSGLGISSVDFLNANRGVEFNDGDFLIFENFEETERFFAILKKDYDGQFPANVMTYGTVSFSENAEPGHRSVIGSHELGTFFDVLREPSDSEIEEAMKIFFDENGKVFDENKKWVIPVEEKKISMKLKKEVNSYNITRMLPFTKVLAKLQNDVDWRLGFFDHAEIVNDKMVFYLVGEFGCDQCIPYSGNEKLFKYHEGILINQ